MMSSLVSELSLSYYHAPSRGCPPASERQRIRDAHPASALHHREKGRARALVLVGTEARLGPVEDVLVALDRFHSFDEAVERQLLAGLFQAEDGQVGIDVAVDRADVRLDLEAVLVAVEPGLRDRRERVTIRH